jgi:hypothetical protein
MCTEEEIEAEIKRLTSTWQWPRPLRLSYAAGSDALQVSCHVPIAHCFKFIDLECKDLDKPIEEVSERILLPRLTALKRAVEKAESGDR